VGYKNLLPKSNLLGYIITVTKTPIGAWFTIIDI